MASKRFTTEEVLLAVMNELNASYVESDGSDISSVSEIELEGVIEGVAKSVVQVVAESATERVCGDAGEGVAKDVVKGFAEDVVEGFAEDVVEGVAKSVVQVIAESAAECVCGDVVEGVKVQSLDDVSLLSDISDISEAGVHFEVTDSFVESIFEQVMSDREITSAVGEVVETLMNAVVNTIATPKKKNRKRNVFQQ